MGTVLAQTRGSVVSIGIALSIWTGSRAVTRYLETTTIAMTMTAHRDRGVSSIAATVTPAGGKNAGPTPAPNDCQDSTAPAR